MRPSVSGGLVFFYYYGIDDASHFYGDVMGFDLKLDREWVKIYKISENSHIGLVDASRGSHKPSDEKPVRLQVIVNDADDWFRYLKGKGIEIPRKEPKVGETLKVKAFSVKDPGGYSVEICEYMSPYGE
jgi:catechol 2,3-dioxygenase-like lactoylglutathione lyase family enzyme